MTDYICHCTHVDGKVYPDPNRTCPNGHTRGAVTEQEWLGNTPILAIPEHIAALPEQEQGPALVNEIHQRKAARMLWDYAGIRTPAYDPFKETRAAIGRLDDYARFLAAMYRDPREEVRAILEGGGTSTPPDNDGFTTHGFPEYPPRPLKVIDDVAPEDVRWECKRPTAPVYAVGSNGWLMEQAAARISPLEREYNRKLNAASRAKARELLLMMGVETFDADD